MPWARHAAGTDDREFQTSTEYVVIDETVAPGSELELVDAFGSVIERWLNDSGAPASDVVRWTHPDPDLEVQIDGRPLPRALVGRGGLVDELSRSSGASTRAQPG